jgi:hypothetical protein
MMKQLGTNCTTKKQTSGEKLYQDLLFFQALFTFSESNGIEFLSWRTWIGMWTFVIAMVVAGFQVSVVVLLVPHCFPYMYICKVI